MSKSDQTPSAPSGDERNVAAADAAAASSPDFEESMRQFWEKNRTMFFAAAVVVLVAILGKNGWTMMQEGKLEAQREAYSAATTDAERRAFANDHAGSTLAGAALLEVADNAFNEGRFEEAKTGYEAAAKELAGTIFADRVTLGRAMAQIAGGDEAGGQSALRAIANDTDVSVAVRGEAAYHLASAAAAKGQLEELNNLATQITSLDPASTWSQRVNMLQASVAPAAAAESGEASTVTFPGS